MLNTRNKHSTCRAIQKRVSDPGPSLCHDRALVNQEGCARLPRMGLDASKRPFEHTVNGTQRACSDRVGLDGSSSHTRGGHYREDRQWLSSPAR